MLLAVADMYTKWDLVRQAIRLIAAAIFIYAYGKVGAVTVKNTNVATAR